MTISITTPSSVEVPVLVECESRMTLAGCLEWVEHHADELHSLLAKHGAVLFRGMAIRTAVDFDSFVAEFEWDNFPYEQSLSNAVRVNRTDERGTKRDRDLFASRDGSDADLSHADFFLLPRRRGYRRSNAPLSFRCAA